jgi:hypothetical protein
MPTTKVIEKLLGLEGHQETLGDLGANLAIVAAALARTAERDDVDRWDPLPSGICSQRWCEGPTYRRWCAAFREPVRYQRKQWEKVFVARALEVHGLLAPGKRGLAFGVGSETLPAIFADRGCAILATDQGLESARKSGWSNEHARALERLNEGGFCDPRLFAERVRMRDVDMNAIPSDLRDFDFCWSCCALEHLGSIEHGLRFVENSVACLRPGGVAAHTLEFNLDSDDATIADGPTVLFRRRDIEALVRRLEAAGHRVLPVDWSTGDAILDDYVDTPPFHESCHLRLRIAGYRCTSLGLVVIRGDA